MPEQDLALERLEPLIFTIRGRRVMLDADLARIYGVTTFAFNQAVKRNADRFPEDFAFQLTADEVMALRSQVATSRLRGTGPQPGKLNSSQFVMSSARSSDAEGGIPNWSQFATSSSKHRGAAYRPWAFTEHGALMAANVLRSERAIEMSVFVIRAFVRLREQVACNQAILKRLAEIDKTLLQHDASLRDIYRKLLPLFQPPPDAPKRHIGFHPDEKRSSRRITRSGSWSLCGTSSAMAAACSLCPPARISAGLLTRR